MSRVIETQAGAARRRRRAIEMGGLLAAHVRAEAAKKDEAGAIAWRGGRAPQKGDAPRPGAGANLEKLGSGRRRRFDLQGLLFHVPPRPSMLNC